MARHERSREAASSGRSIEWDLVLNSKTSLVPEKLEWGSAPKAEAPMPGKYRLV